ncbi:MAG: LamG domain-containing protein [Candidatus Marsarchaeota archaeon]|nr:LamG domain-containing protein [Candidatus Marsarchaeota archaeon]
MAQRRAQSAMEYLMTYGWAILIIAVVLGALFQLGVFNAGTFAPRAPPGACQVFRPNGPGSASFINLEGVCNGELPQYVLESNGQNGNQYIQIAYSSTLAAVAGQFSLSWWFSPALPASTTYDEEMITSRCQGDATFDMQLENGGLHGDIGTGQAFLTTGVNYDFGPSQSAWYYVVTEFTSTGWSIYLNGNNVSHGTYVSGTPSLVYNGNSLNIGSSCGASDFTGSMADIQLYNSSLSANEIQALYLEGIGGAPIKLQNLAGWWPLNGNANDYSGNDNNGAPIIIAGTQASTSYTSAWAGGYTPP